MLLTGVLGLNLSESLHTRNFCSPTDIRPLVGIVVFENNYGEILAAGPNAGETAVQQWIESQPHYLPMIYKGHTMGGVGIAKHPTWGYIVTGRMGTK